MANHTIKITLDDKEERFLKLMAKRDNVTIQEELKMVFYPEFNHCMELYADELEMDESPIVY